MLAAHSLLFCFLHHAPLNVYTQDVIQDNQTFGVYAILHIKSHVNGLVNRKWKVLSRVLLFCSIHPL